MKSNKKPLPLPNQHVRLDDRFDAIQATKDRTIPLSFDNRVVGGSTSRNLLMHRPENKFNMQESLKQTGSSRSQSPASLSRSQIQSYIDLQNNSLSSPLHDGIGALNQSSIFGGNSVQTMSTMLMDDSILDTQDNETVQSVQSENTSYTELISLFHRSDDRSVAKYISELVKDEMGMEKKEQYQASDAVQQAMQSRPPSMPHTPKTFKDTEDALNYAIKCNNLSHWSISSTGVKVKSLNFRIIETIVYRESILMRLKDHLTVLDKYYWKYAVERVKEAGLGHTNLHSESLVIKRNQIFNMQNELSVGIAHLRSLSITIIEYIQKLRVLIDKEIRTTTSISVYWKGENYLLRLLHDCDFLFEYMPIRYWIGFVPNGLMIPPADHDPKQQWKKVAGGLLTNFLQSYKEKFMKHQPKPQNRGRKSVVHDRKLISDNLGIASKPSSPPSDPLRPIVHSSSNAALTNSNLSTTMTAASHSISNEEWQQLRDYCTHSWEDVILRPETWPYAFITKVDSEESESTEEASNAIRCPIQHIEASSAFWNNAEHNPFVIEAAVGFAELFPSIYIVPQLPNELLSNSLRLKGVLTKEKIDMVNLEMLKESAARKKEDYENRLSSDNSGLAHVLAATEGFEERVMQHHKLKMRQQGDSSVLSGIDAEHVKRTTQVSLKTKKDSLADSLAYQDSMSTFDLANDRIFALTTSISNSVPDKKHAGLLSDDNSSIAESTIMSSSSHLSKTLVSIDEYPTFRLEKTDNATRRRIEGKIDDDRQFVDTKARKLREDRRGRREVSRLDEKWFNKHARNIQRLFRGFVARKRFRSMVRRAIWRRVVTRIQAVMRGFIARLKENRSQRAYKIETFLLRKDAIKRFRAAVTITQFIRRVVNLRRLQKCEPLLFDRMDMRGRPVSQFETLRNLRNALLPSQIQELSERANPYQQMLTSDELFENPSTPANMEFSSSASILHYSPSRMDSLGFDNQSVGFGSSVASSSVLSFKLDDETASQGSERMENEFDPFFKEENTADATQMQLSQISLDEVERQKYEKLQAIELIKRVNEGKFQHDTLRTCRLIPTKEIRTPTCKVSVKKFSKKSYNFLQEPDVTPCSTLKSTIDAFVHPMPKFSKTSPSHGATSPQGDHLSISSSTSSLQSLGGGSLQRSQTSKSHSKLILPSVPQSSDKSVSSRSKAWSDHLSMKEMKKQEKEQREQEVFRTALRKLMH